MKILIVDDHPLIRQGLKQVLLGELEVSACDEAGTATEALGLLRAGNYDILVLDINLPDRSGLAVLKEMRQFDERLPVLVLSIHPEGSLAVQALKAGANGYLSKESAPEELANALRRLAAGGSYITASLSEALVLEVSGRSAAEPHDILSDREYQVMCMLATGQSIVEIAATLRLRTTTISTYRARILDKMGMKSNAELTRYAISRQLIA